MLEGNLIEDSVVIYSKDIDSHIDNINEKSFNFNKILGNLGRVYLLWSCCFCSCLRTRHIKKLKECFESPKRMILPGANRK